jgi:hypothetical protein
MRIVMLIAAAAVSVGSMLIGTATAHAAAVTASECRHGNGVVKVKPHYPHVCFGGLYDGAEVWS